MRGGDFGEAEEGGSGVEDRDGDADEDTGNDVGFPERAGTTLHERE